jgi:hypothetical protein
MNMMIQFPVMRTDVTINVALEGRASYELGMGYLISCDINETTDTVALGLVNNHNFIFPFLSSLYSTQDASVQTVRGWSSFRNS